ncbi:hypothetical protein [Naasia aerilata]|uniref:Uncharacterized protein n=1 Tax=Naasia aerilata TaxID=1162966 RepID=A0ABN6XJQ5_9MICO|nr:hypothetical protein [Naasia aerilata]BDZ45041.1 hypothetical protein GCM10025866_09500 [Naasia aerilata]
MSEQPERPARAEADAPEQSAPSDPIGRTRKHLETVEVDTIDGQFFMPGEVADEAHAERHVLILDTTGAPVAQSPSPEDTGDSVGLEPVVVDTIDGQFVVPAQAEEGFSDHPHVDYLDSTGAPVADEDDAERNGFPHA